MDWLDRRRSYSVSVVPVDRVCGENRVINHRQFEPAGDIARVTREIYAYWLPYRIAMRAPPDRALRHCLRIEQSR